MPENKEYTSEDINNAVLLAQDARRIQLGWALGKPREKIEKEWTELLHEVRLLKTELECRNQAFEEVYDLVRDWQPGGAFNEDRADAVVRCTIRRLEEAFGEPLTRLLKERPEGQKLYSLHYRDLREENEKLKEKLNCLPKTKDGVPVIPGSSKVYRLAIGDEHDCDHYVKNGVEKSINWNGWAATFATDLRRYPGWVGGYDPSELYSTPEAALASIKE